jgi:chromosome segregation ATPase
MTDLFDKLNMLVRSGLRDLIGGDVLDVEALRRALTPERMGKGLAAEVTALRQRINQALDYEDELKARVETLQAEVSALDGDADAALARGEHDAAHALVEKHQRAQQRLTMAESDLRAHRMVTQELIQRVNMLEAAVADHAANAAATPPTPVADPERTSVADVLRSVREQIAGEPKAASLSSPAAPPVSSSPKAIEDDLERRRQRLTKP